MIRVGTAGWSYPDWDGIVYPRGAAASGRALTALIDLFDAIEINTTFYRPAPARMTETWAARAARRPGFRFTAKLWRRFTHDRDAADAEEQVFREGLAPLIEAGCLAAILIQFPWSFRDDAPGRAHLEALLERFEDLPIVVELRHASWLHDGTFALLLRRGAGFCNIDQPASADAIGPTARIAAGPGYVRLHGRNREAWFRRDAGRDERYDYLYSREECREWVDRIRQMQSRAPDRDIFVIANNHYRGQAPANALEILALLTGHPVPVPEGLRRTYPRLDAIAARLGPAGETGNLPW